MERISDVKIESCEQSSYVKPLRLTFEQDGKAKTWDAVQAHDSVVILIFNKSRNVFVLVKQFRPAVYMSAAEITTRGETRIIESSKNSGHLGITFELCAGIVDKNIPLPELAKAEVFEECGYEVPVEKFEHVASYRSNVGISGAMQNLYFVEVTDDMKTGKGGGMEEEGEMIDVVEIPLLAGKKFIMDTTYTKPVAAMFAMMWFFENKLHIYDKKNS